MLQSRREAVRFKIQDIRYEKKLQTLPTMQNLQVKKYFNSH